MQRGTHELISDELDLQGHTKEDVSSLLEDPAKYNLNKGNGSCSSGQFLTANSEAQFVISHVKETGLGCVVHTSGLADQSCCSTSNLLSRSPG